jgi:integrase
LGTSKLVEEESSIAKLLAAGKLARQTKENYVLRIRAYLRRSGMSPDQFAREVKRHPKKFEEEFVKFIGEVSKESAPSTVAFWRDSLRRFLEINRVTGVDWNYVNQFLPKVRKSGQDRAPTAEEIRKLASVADLRTKCLILLLCSSGARIGSVDYLRWKDFQEVEVDGKKLARATIYRGEPEEYSTFVTPESWEYLSRYREMREKVGEKVTPSSPVFIQEVNKRRFSQNKVKPVGVRTLKNQLGELMNHMGMRSTLMEKENYRSYEFKQAHGFRKFFKTRLEVAGVKPLVIETLMGHSTGVSSSYFKPTDKELLEEYAKGIKELTVFKSEETVTQNMILTAFNKQFLANSGYTEEEIAKLGDLSQLSPQKMQELIREKQMRALGLNGNHQKIVAMNELEDLVAQGWDFVTALPDNKAVVKLPSR